MRNIDEILNNEKIAIIFRNVKNDKCIQLKLNVRSKYTDKLALVKFTQAMGWEHVCVSFEDETPSWDIMQEMKEIFWTDDEEAFQLHPRKDNYINNHDHCLHIWRPTHTAYPIPPSILVGFRGPKYEIEDKAQLKKMQAELGSPMSDQEIDFMYKSSVDKDYMKNELNKVLNNMSLEDLLKML